MRLRDRALRALLIGALASGSGPRPGRAEGLAIEHDPVACIVAGVFPRLDACFVPGADVARARVHFRARGTPHWYFVDMSAPGACRSVLLPKPLPTTSAIEYYVSAVDQRFAEARTRDYGPRVVKREGECGRDLLVAAGTGSAVVLLGLVAGAPPVPPGFDPQGIVGAGPGGGPPSAAQQGGGGGTGGIGVLLGLAALGGGGYYLYKQLEGDEDPETEASPLDGTWEGLTSQNRPVTMTVAGSNLTRFQTSVEVSSGSTLLLVPIQRTFSPGLALARGAFSFQQPTEPPLLVTGTFDASGVADGRVDTGGRQLVSWRASKR